LDPATALASLPPRLRQDLLDAFAKIVRNFRERRWEPSELNGGKLCEAAYSILRGHVDGRLPARASKPRNMVDACRKREQDGAAFPRSVQIQIPRMLTALYEIRNNRGVGHLGGDVDPNHMDAKAVLEMSKWVMAELVRVFHNVTTDEATQVVDALVERTVPVVWEVEPGHRRVLNPDLSKKDQALLLLFSATGWLSEGSLLRSLDNPSHLRRDILQPLHDARLVELDKMGSRACISPRGIAYVEENLPLET
jgi:hypothetical protein